MYRLLCLGILLSTPLAAQTLTAVDNSMGTNPWKNVSFPVDNFKRISSPFGVRNNATNGEGTEFHAGLDLAAPEGSYIRDWANGLVQKVEYDSRCGWHVTINSGAWVHTYCHISAVAVKVGDVVQAGQVIAAVGTSGRTTGPHLHWSLRYNGQLVDPYLVLQEMQKAWQPVDTTAPQPVAALR